jgi:hypothetical protein
MVTQDRLKELFNYNKLTGLFTRILKVSPDTYIGEIAGYISTEDNYVRIEIDNRVYLAHRLAFLYVEGYIPTYIDHVDTVRCNNIWANLRECTKSQNGLNSKINSLNTVGVKGLTWNKAGKTYVARLRIEGNCYSKSFSVFTYKLQDIALREATYWIRDTRQKLCGAFTNHG